MSGRAIAFRGGWSGLDAPAPRLGVTRFSKGTCAMTVGQVILKDEKGKSILDTKAAITSENVGQFRIPAERVEKTAAKLKDMGFAIESKDELGISVSGPEALFKRIFDLSASSACDAKARIPKQLSDYVAGVVIPEAPEFFP